EYQYHVTKKLDITPGVKFAYYTIGTQQFADDGKTIGGLGTNNPNTFVSNGGSYFATLPSVVGNYRLRSNLSVFAQYAQGSIVPPSSVFDYQQGTTAGTFIPVQTLPQQQKNTTYETGIVTKLKRVTFDADYFHIHFDNSYSSFSNQSTGGEPVFFAQPASVTQGLEGEANLYFLHGLSLYLNSSYDKATYTGSQAVSCTSGSAGCTASTPQLTLNTPSGLNVAQTPSDVETEGLTYQHSNWDAGFFNKRVGTEYQDNGAYHNQFTIAPFNISNLFVNYTLRSGGRLNGTKFRLSFNNLFNQHSVTGVTLVNGPATQTIAANGTTYTNPFTTNGQTSINGQDNVSILAARSIMLTVTLGTSTKR
ncbi:MAG TPA: TonB-dependent receptor, partial [Acidobacteriaceae bacterium]|nr:TonB-dependent receptor [Acidobacteriaceae bacterium]